MSPDFITIKRNMLLSENISIEDFCVVGINYKSSDTSLRGKYAVQDEQYQNILEAARAEGIQEIFVLSTCNRTEIYGCVTHFSQLEKLINTYTIGDSDYFLAHAYRKKGKDAIIHIFNVAAGLDSQILGDYEIVGQLKKAILFATEKKAIGIFTDRLFKNVLQSCRAIRSKTKLSSGTVSVAYAAVLFLKKQAQKLPIKNILVLGSGKIGNNTCKNLLSTFPDANITLINRTQAKAQQIANKLNQEVKVASFAKLQSAIQQSQAIIVATNSSTPIINQNNLSEPTPKILIDLSIPNNINPNVANLNHITLANVDDLSKINDQTIRLREQEIPAARAYITFYIHQFAEWYLMRENVPILKSVKEKLSELNHNLVLADQAEDKEIMQKVINNMAAKIKKEGRKSGCYYIEALNGYLSEVDTAQIHN